MYLRLCTLLVSATVTSLSLHECALDTFRVADTLPHIDVHAQCTRGHSTVDAICTCIAENEADYRYIIHNWHHFTAERQRYCAGYVSGCLAMDRPIDYAAARDCLEPPQSTAPRMSARPIGPDGRGSGRRGLPS